MWVPGFLAALAESGNVSTACRSVGIDRSTPYDVRKEDADFAAAWDGALDQATDALEAEARRRAHAGLVRKKFDKGQPVIDPETGSQYVEHEYSDTLLIFLLKAHRPEKFRERYEVDAKVKVSGAMEIREIVVTTREQADRLIPHIAGPGGVPGRNGAH